MTDRYFTGARRRKFWTFQNFRTATATNGAQWRSAAFTHGCVCVLWRSTAFIHGFWTAAERRQKPPMCNSGLTDLHYNDVIMSAMASQLTSLTIVYSIVYSGADQIKHQSSASLAFVRGIHRWPAGLDIRKFHPWFDLQPKFHYRNHNFLNTFREILSHHIWYFLAL